MNGTVGVWMLALLCLSGVMEPGEPRGIPGDVLMLGVEHWGPQGAIPTAFPPGSSKPSCRTSGMTSPGRAPCPAAGRHLLG